MDIHKVVLKDVKSFQGTVEFNFDNKTNINTISGVNGAGKTTLFKSILLAQRAFFLEQLNEQSILSETLEKDLLSYLSLKTSEIKLIFKLGDDSNFYPTFSIKCKERQQHKIAWEFMCEDGDKEEILKYWNVSNPRQIIVYVDSNRNITENDFTHEGISLRSNVQGDDLALDYIFHPDRLFANIYERVIKDYIRERVIPNQPRRDLPHIASRALIHKLLPNIIISNFSGIQRDNEFIIQIKPTEKSTQKSQYDLRNLSSGEKTIFYLIHFICYVKNIGMLVIDEPENNLHENLLAQVIKMLNNICLSSSFGELIITTAKELGVKLEPKFESQVKVYYKNHELSRVYLLTHSKNLIYHNFSIGTNYVIDGKLKLLSYENVEKELRTIGLSIVQTKVLFVEGKSDTELLQGILDPYNIKVRNLGSCSEVIETYKKYLLLKKDIKDVQYCFMIDKDTRGTADIEQLRRTDNNSFVKYFLILDRHEIENYFLDGNIFVELFKRNKELNPELHIPTYAEFNKMIERIANEYKENVFRKTIQNLNQKSFGSLKASVSEKNMPIDSDGNYKAYIEKSFSPVSLEKTSNLLKQNYAEALLRLSNWEKDWQALCDGKIVFNKFISEVSTLLEMYNSLLLKQVIMIGCSSNKYDPYKIVNEILKKFELKL